MTKKEYLKKSKLFLKMARYDFAIINIIKIAKTLLTAALFLNAAAFAVTFAGGAKKLKS